MAQLVAEDFPILEWGPDHAYVCRRPRDFGLMLRSQLVRLQTFCRNGDMRLLTATGRTHHVVDMLPIVPGNFVLRWFTAFRVQNILDEGRAIDLKEFKRRVEWAVRERQRGDYDSDFLGELRPKLLTAQSFREAIDAVPSVM